MTALPANSNPHYEPLGRPHALSLPRELRPGDECASHKFSCGCRLCAEYEHRKLKQALQMQTQRVNSKIRQRVLTSNTDKLQARLRDYRWVIEHLTLPASKIVTAALGIFVAESLFFREGEASEVFVSRDVEDPTIKRIPHQKLTNPFIQKLFSDRRRRYREYVRTKAGLNKDQKKKPLYGQKEAKKEIKDAVLVSYVDGYEQLISENQFLSMFLRRKQDPIWKQIASVRNFLNITNPEQERTSYLVSKFTRSSVKHPELFERALVLTKINGQYITTQSKEYISAQQEQQFQQTLQRQDKQMYADYLAYQIITFIEYFHDQLITQLVVGLFLDQVGHAFLHEVYKLEVQGLVKFQWTNQIYRHRMDDEQSRILQKQKNVDELSVHKKSSIIVRAMMSAYERMRDTFGLNAQPEDNKQQKANNQFFRHMHPQFDHNISDLLKDPDMNLTDFKRVYLGHTPKRKSIVKEFTSPMIKTIHLATPRLRVSEPHDYMPDTKRTSSTIDRTERKIERSFLTPGKVTPPGRLYQTISVSGSYN